MAALAMLFALEIDNSSLNVHEQKKTGFFLKLPPNLAIFFAVQNGENVKNSVAAITAQGQICFEIQYAVRIRQL